MYKYKAKQEGGFMIESQIEGETIEQKVHRIVNNNEPIKDGAPIIHTTRAEGISAGYDIRTDRFEIALEATDYITKSNLTKREERGKIIKMKNEEENGETETIQGTDNK